MMVGEIPYLITKPNLLIEYLLQVLLEHSSVDYQEDMLLRASFNYYYQEMFQCEKKIDRFYDLNIKRKKLPPKEAMEQAVQMVETMNSCSNIKPNPLYNIDGYDFYTCVCNFIHPEIHFFFTLFNQYETKGTLPFPGSLSEQPAYIIEVFNVLTSLKTEYEIEQQKKQQNNNKR